MRFLLSVLLLCATSPVFADDLRFVVTAANGLLDRPADGRMLVVLQQGQGREPRFSIGRTGVNAPPVLGKDGVAFGPGKELVLDGGSAIFPIESLAKLPAGDYSVQAIFHSNRDLNLPNAPGNLYSPVVKVRLDPKAGGAVKLELNQKYPAEQMPADTATIKYLKFESKALSKFHGRPMFLRCGVVLPSGFEKNPEKTYPLRVHIGGYGTRFTAVRALRQNDKFLQLMLDGAGPLGDPYQVDSANHGPYGTALTQELIPHVEKTFRGNGKRVTDGASTGGWVSLALQVFYPDFFSGCWSHCPDPVDFRCFELIDIYRDENAYVNKFGFERAGKRNIDGDVMYHVRHECQLENVLGKSDSWVTSGKDWCAWNATFGPRGADGLPIPLWNPKTGAIDRSVVENWKKYDLRLVMQSHWKTLGPKLHGKVRVYVGDADDYFLNNAVHRLNDFLKTADPPFGGVVRIVPRAGHTVFLREDETIAEMSKAVGSP